MNFLYHAILQGALLTGVLAQDWVRTTLPVPEPAREFRAAWVTSVYNLDWPSKPGLPKEKQQEELRGLLDSASQLGLNAVLLQVRPGGDALYSSRLEPWSSVLTGKSGGDPGYDPLAFAVEEAHRCGLELHAWFNPFRAKVGKAASDAKHWTVQHPEWVRGKDSHVFMDPCLAAVQAHVLAVFKDVVSRYDVDGVHIDDYFYPYPVFGPDKVRIEVPLGDEAQWQLGGKGQTLADWRRGNINRFVQAFYSQTKALKPAVRVGISPFGIWQPGVPASIEARVNAYDHLYGDSRRWLQEGWCDYLAPQLYWPIQPAAQSFTTLMQWWQSQSRGRPVWPGMAVDRVASLKEPLLPMTELNDQMAVMRQTAPVPGSIFWRMQYLAKDGRGVATSLKSARFTERALVPPAPWLGAVPPGDPVVTISSTAQNQPLTVSWTASQGAPARWWALQILNGGKWVTEPSVFGIRTNFALPANTEAVAVRAISASGLASKAVVWALQNP